MLAAFELVKDKSSREKPAPDGQAGIFCRDAAVNNGLMIRAVGNSIISAPPLICNNEEIDMLIAKLVQALDVTATEFGVTA